MNNLYEDMSQKKHSRLLLIKVILRKDLSSNNLAVTQEDVEKVHKLFGIHEVLHARNKIRL